IQREVDMLKAAGEHGNLVKCFGTVNDDDGPCILYELCMPENLWHLLRNRGAIIKEETRFFISKIADGLTHLHGRGLIHCDLKPENVLQAPGMKVRIGDLGLAERYDPNSQR
ncbi:polo-like kinase 3, partial [Linnemannia gamsii]